MPNRSSTGQTRIPAWLIIAALALLLLDCGRRPPPQPPTPPSPSPTPAPGRQPLRAVDGRFDPLIGLGCAGCCDCPRTPFWDEGLDEGWSAPTAGYLDRVRGRCDLTVIRVGPYSDVGLGYIAEAARAQRDAADRGMYVEVDLADNWALATAGMNAFGDTCAVTQGAPPQRWVDYVRQVVDAVTAYQDGWNVVFNLGNEGFRCEPSPEWEQGLYDVAKARLRERGHDRLVGSQHYYWPGAAASLGDPALASTGLLPVTLKARSFRVGAKTLSAPGSRKLLSVSRQAARRLFDYVAYGAYPVRLAAPPRLGVPVLVEEDDGGRYRADDWRRFLLSCEQNGVACLYWRGQMELAEDEDVLAYPRPVADLADCSTPPTGAEQCESRTDNPGLPSAFWQQVDAAVDEVVAAHPELYRREPDGAYTKDRREEALHLRYVSEALRRRGHCAGIYYGEEVAVMSLADKSLSENYDLLRSDGLVRKGMGSHRATCRPGTIVGGASDATNGPRVP